MHLPNEIIDIVLENLEFRDLLALRVVSSRYRDLVASFCSRKKSLALIRRCGCYTFPGPSGSQWSVDERFFGDLKIADFMWVRFSGAHFLTPNRDFADFIMSLFPNVEILAVGGVPSRRRTIDSIISLITQWTRVWTLVFSGWHLPSECRDALAAAINGLTQLKRLDFGGFYAPRLFEPTLARVHHLSVEPRDAKDFVETVRRLGPHCTRLWTCEKVWTELGRGYEPIGACLIGLPISAFR